MDVTSIRGTCATYVVRSQLNSGRHKHLEDRYDLSIAFSAELWTSQAFERPMQPKLCVQGSTVDVISIWGTCATYVVHSQLNRLSGRHKHLEDLYILSTSFSAALWTLQALERPVQSKL